MTMESEPKWITPELPEWMIQSEQVARGEKKWEDFSFEERTCKGWLIPYLLELETQMCGRWMWWTDAMVEGKLPDTQIPRIQFFPEGFGHYDALPKSKKAKASEYDPVKMLLACIDHYTCHSARLPDFFEWILWGFGANEKRARIDEKVNEHWYRTFNLGLLLKYPHDYLGDMMAEAKSGGRTYWNNPHAFFPTPHNVVDCMVRMNFDGQKHEDGKDPRTLSVCDPCVGSGRFLMYSSNYSVNLYGMDIDSVCVMACKINAFMYVPWLVRPAPWLNMMEPIQVGDSLQHFTLSFDDNQKTFSKIKDKKKPQLTLWGSEDHGRNL